MSGKYEGVEENQRMSRGCRGEPEDVAKNRRIAKNQRGIAENQRWRTRG